MTADVASTDLTNLAPGSHVCWIVGDPADYVEAGLAILAGAALTNEKPVVFGPEGAARDALAGSAVIAADPRTAFLAGGPLEPSTMFAMFEEQSTLARAEGYRGLRLVADMDWLLPMEPTTRDVIAFELLLDRHASRLDATIVCAYRTDTFDTRALMGASCVHPIGVGDGDGAQPQFRLVSAEGESWRLLGEVDVAVTEDFEAAMTAAVSAGPCVVDASSLEFLDLAAMRRLAAVAAARDASVRVVGAPTIVRRGWQAAGFAEVAPQVELAH